MGGFGRGEGKVKCCNYTIISKIKLQKLENICYTHMKFSGNKEEILRRNKGHYLKVRKGS